MRHKPASLQRHPLTDVFTVIFGKPLIFVRSVFAHNRRRHNSAWLVDNRPIALPTFTRQRPNKLLPLGRRPLWRHIENLFKRRLAHITPPETTVRTISVFRPAPQPVTFPPTSSPRSTDRNSESR